VFAAAIVWRLDLQFDFSEVGLSNFLVYFALPLGIAGLSIPLGAICASQHRTLQTAKQIDAQEEQNKLSNYYKHIEEFHKYIKECESESTRNIDLASFNYRTFHRKIFSELRKGNDKPTILFFEELIEDLTPLMNFFITAPPKGLAGTYYVDHIGNIWPTIVNRLELCFERYGIKVRALEESISSGYEQPLVPRLSSVLLNQTQRLESLISIACEFSETPIYKFPSEFEKIYSTFHGIHTIYMTQLINYESFKSDVLKVKTSVKKNGSLQQQGNQWSSEIDDAYDSALSYLKNHATEMQKLAEHDSRFDSVTVGLLKKKAL
jgi:hypothetical protein